MSDSRFGGRTVPLIAGPKLIDFDDVPSALMDETAAMVQEALNGSRPSDAPRLIHMCGIPGAGKTTYATDWLARNSAFVSVQFDAVMAKLSGYQKDRVVLGLSESFKVWELPARAIGYHLFQSLIENRRNVLFDHSATSKQHIDLINRVKNKGYTVEMHYLNCAPEEALRRVKEREKTIQRHTPESLIFERHELLPELLPEYKMIVDHFVCVSSN